MWHEISISTNAKKNTPLSNFFFLFAIFLSNFSPKYLWDYLHEYWCLLSTYFQYQLKVNNIKYLASTARSGLWTIKHKGAASPLQPFFFVVDGKSSGETKSCKSNAVFSKLQCVLRVELKRAEPGDKVDNFRMFIDTKIQSVLTWKICCFGHVVWEGEMNCLCVRAIFHALYTFELSSHM